MQTLFYRVPYKSSLKLNKPYQMVLESCKFIKNQLICIDRPQVMTGPCKANTKKDCILRIFQMDIFNSPQIWSSNFQSGSCCYFRVKICWLLIRNPVSITRCNFRHHNLSHKDISQPGRFRLHYTTSGTFSPHKFIRSLGDMSKFRHIP